MLGIEELPNQDFALIEPIISSAHENPEALAIAQGMNPGRIFVDDVNTPTAALIWSYGIEGFYLVGDAKSRVFSKHLSRYVQETITPEAKRSGLDWFEVSGDSNHWDKLIVRIFANRNIERSRQCVYRLTDETCTRDLLRDMDRENVQRICPRLLRESGVKNYEFLRAKLDQFWSEYDDFFKAGVGYAVIHKQEIASLCFSAFVAEDIHVVDVETTLANRGQGFSKMAAAAFLCECLGRALQPYWDCMSNNAASRGLAESLGFRKVREYMLHSFQLNGESFGERGLTPDARTSRR